MRTASDGSEEFRVFRPALMLIPFMIWTAVLGGLGWLILRSPVPEVRGSLDGWAYYILAAAGFILGPLGFLVQFLRYLSVCVRVGPHSGLVLSFRQVISWKEVRRVENREGCARGNRLLERLSSDVEGVGNVAKEMVELPPNKVDRLTPWDALDLLCRIHGASSSRIGERRRRRKWTAMDSAVFGGGCAVVWIPISLATLLLAYSVLPVAVVYSPWHSRVIVHLKSGEKVVLRDFKDDDYLVAAIRHFARLKKK